ncbi:hypothetical protein BAS10_12950 [Elizabethkingia meningoseptica]|nr:hypothetical protein BAS10_12950 [Elizabethkingia meningoseptica]
MIRYTVLTAIFLNCMNISGQKKMNCDNIEKEYNTFSFRKSTSPKEDIKKCLERHQKKIKIEIINEGDWNQINQILYLKFVRINNGIFTPAIVNNSNIELLTQNQSTQNWEGGRNNALPGLKFNNFSDYLEMYQEYQSKKNEKGTLESVLKPIEIYETIIPVYTFSLAINSHRKDYKDATVPTNLIKKINIYADEKLIKTLTYSYDELSKAEGINIKDFKL